MYKSQTIDIILTWKWSIW